MVMENQEMVMESHGKIFMIQKNILETFFESIELFNPVSEVYS